MGGMRDKDIHKRCSEPVSGSASEVDRLEAEYVVAKHEYKLAAARLKAIKEALMPLREAATKTHEEKAIAHEANVLRAFVKGATKAQCASMLGRKSPGTVDTLIDQFMRQFIPEWWKDPEFRYQDEELEHPHGYYRRCARRVLQAYEATQ